MDESPIPEPGPTATSQSALAVVGCVSLVAVLIGWLAWEAAGVRRRSTATPVSSTTQPDYVGSRACAECHPGEASLHARSGHARTLRSAAELDLARWLSGKSVADPELPEASWNYRLQDNRLIAERTEGKETERQVLDFAFGSGNHAVTFVSLIDESAPTCREHRLTHYTHTNELAITPGQRADTHEHGTTPHGRFLSQAETLKCFRCHTTRTSAHDPEKLDRATMIPNVSCERCHGPGSQHVEAQRRGLPDRSMSRSLDVQTAEKEMLFCGQCHRHPSQAPPGRIRPDNVELARFQPAALMQSRCYRESEGALRCATCHDPHATARSDPRNNEGACLKCHDAAPQTVCHVSPTGGCIACHMPGVDSGQGILFTDHWIRIRDDTAPSRP